VAEAKQPVAIRIVRPYDSGEAFTENEGDTIGKTSIVLLGAQSRPQGVILRFEITINNGEAMMRGEGRVLAFKDHALHDLPGLVLRYTRLDPKSKALVDRLAAAREGLMSAPAEAPASDPEAVEVAASGPLPTAETGPEQEPSAQPEDRDDAGTDPPPPGSEPPVTDTQGEPVDDEQLVAASPDPTAAMTPAPVHTDAPHTDAPHSDASQSDGPATDPPPPSDDVEVDVRISEPPPSIDVQLVEDDEASYDELSANAAHAPEPEPAPEPESEPAPAPTPAPPPVEQNSPPEPVDTLEPLVAAAPPENAPELEATPLPEPLATTPSIEPPPSLPEVERSPSELPDEVPTRSREVSELTREALLEKLRRRGERLGAEGTERLLAASPNRTR
jgi:hypothetical protein